MINNLTLVGRLTRDAELRHTGSGTAVANFTVAAERPFTNAQGERETDFVNCVTWRKTAEALSNYTSKGSLIGLTGRIQTRNYENKEGKKVYVTEVVAETIRFLDGKQTQKQESKSTKGNYTQSDKSATEDKNEGNNEIDVSDDDLPF